MKKVNVSNDLTEIMLNAVDETLSIFVTDGEGELVGMVTGERRNYGICLHGESPRNFYRTRNECIRDNSQYNYVIEVSI